MEEEEVVMMTVMMETQRVMDERNNLKVPDTHHTHYSYVTYRQLCEWEVLNRQYLVGYGGKSIIDLVAPSPIS